MQISTHPNCNNVTVSASSASAARDSDLTFLRSPVEFLVKVVSISMNTFINYNSCMHIFIFNMHAHINVCCHDQLLRNEHGYVSEHLTKLENMQCNCNFLQGSMAMPGIALHANADVDESGAADQDERGSDVAANAGADACASESRGHVLMRGLTCPCAIQCLSRLQEHVRTQYVNSMSFRFNTDVHWL